MELSDILHVTLDELLGKQTEAVQVLPLEKRKKVENMFFRIKVNSGDGDNVKINIPLILAKVFVESGSEMPKINGKNVLSGVDFAQLFELIEQGVVGKIVEVESAEGDTVEIWVE